MLRNPFSGLEKEKKVVWQYTRWPTNQADTAESTYSFSSRQPCRNQSWRC